MDDVSFKREISLWLSQANRHKNGATVSQMQTSDNHVAAVTAKPDILYEEEIRRYDQQI
jgi:hypothetical protein